MAFQIRLIQFYVAPESMPCVQGNSGKIYGNAVYNEKLGRHEFVMSEKAYHEAHKDLAMALRRPGCQWLALAEPIPFGDGGDEAAVLTALRAELELVKKQLALSESLKPQAEPEKEHPQIAEPEAPSLVISKDGLTQTGHYADSLSDVRIEVNPPVGPVEPIVIPEAYPDLEKLAKSLGIKNHPKQSTAILRAAVEAALAKPL